jgi:hypothetical protein
MEYHTICHPLSKIAVIRRADHGITDAEWEHGCRIKPETPETFYKILDDFEWSEYMSSLDEPGIVPNNNYINSYPVLDKWDGGKSY